MKTKVSDSLRLGVYAALILGLWAMPAVVQGATVYEQYFTNTASGNQAVSYAGWSSYVTTATQSALNISNTTTTTPWTGISSASGNPTGTIGYLAIVNYATSSSISAVTTGLSLNLSGATTVTWNMNSSSAMGVRFLIQIGTNWYASDSLINTPTAVIGDGTAFANAGTAAQVSFAFNSLKTTWRDFTLVDGGSSGTGSMSLGSTTLASDLDTSLVTGIGFYQTGGAVSRIDSLVISTVPEPETGALLILSIGLGVVLSRTRRRALFNS